MIHQEKILLHGSSDEFEYLCNMLFRKYRFSFFLLLPALFVGLQGCFVETGKSVKDNELAIVSDYLEAKDTILFENFKKKFDCRIFIRKMNTDQLVGYIRNAQHNSGLDLVMMKSTNSLLELNKKGVLHRFGNGERSFHLDSSYISTKYNFIGIGFDPFVMCYSSDTIPQIKTYSSLSKRKHYNYLTDEDKLVFLSPLRKEQTRATFYSWVKDWKQQSQDVSLFDSLNTGNPILMLYSDFKAIPEKWKDSIEINYPNGKKTGNFFNLRTISLIKQAEHFTLAKKFISFYRNPGYNEDLSEQMNLVPLFYPILNTEHDFIAYPVPPEKALEYQLIIQRMLDKIGD